MQSSANQAYIPLVDVYRGRLVESIHQGVVAVANAEGRVIASLGSPEVVTFPRSSLKAFQALELVESGAADAFRLQPFHLALACASHRAERFQVEAVKEWLSRVEAAPSDLACGPAWPKDLADRDRMIADRETESTVCNNCSGKHTGMLSVCRHRGLQLRGYHHTDHPLQEAILQRVGRLVGRTLEKGDLGIDGCNLPAIPLAIHDMAAAVARFAARKGDSPNESDAMGRLIDAMTQHPEYVSGLGQPTQKICEVTNGRVLVKTGAEGFLVAWLPKDGLGVAIKTADGAERARFAILIEALARLKLLSGSELEAMVAMRRPEIFSTSGDVTGWLECRSDAFSQLL